MDLTFSDSDLSFRQEVIAFLNTEYPLDIKEKAILRDNDDKKFLKELNKNIKHKVDIVMGYVSSGDCLAIPAVAEELKKLTILTDCGTPRVFEERNYNKK